VIQEVVYNSSVLVYILFVVKNHLLLYFNFYLFWLQLIQ